MPHDAPVAQTTCSQHATPQVVVESKDATVAGSLNAPAGGAVAGALATALRAALGAALPAASANALNVTAISSTPASRRRTLLQQALQYNYTVSGFGPGAGGFATACAGATAVGTAFSGGAGAAATAAAAALLSAGLSAAAVTMATRPVPTAVVTVQLLAAGSTTPADAAASLTTALASPALSSNLAAAGLPGVLVAVASPPREQTSPARPPGPASAPAEWWRPAYTGAAAGSGGGLLLLIGGIIMAAKLRSLQRRQSYEATARRMATPMPAPMLPLLCCPQSSPSNPPPHPSPSPQPPWSSPLPQPPMQRVSQLPSTTSVTGLVSAAAGRPRLCNDSAQLRGGALPLRIERLAAELMLAQPEPSTPSTTQMNLQQPSQARMQRFLSAESTFGLGAVAVPSRGDACGSSGALEQAPPKLN